MNTLSPPSDADWHSLLELLPSDRAASAQELGAFCRRRAIGSADVLLRLAMVYSWGSLSLRNTRAWAAQKGIAHLSDVALLERLQRAVPWLSRLLAQKLLQRTTDLPSLGTLPYRIRLVDATVVCRPGSLGTDWRIHLGLDLHTQTTDFLELTDAKGGETLTRFPVQKADLLIGDRGYAHRRGIWHVVSSGGEVLLRFSPQNLPLQSLEGQPFSLLEALASLSEGEIGDFPVQTAPVPKEGILPIRGRVIALRLVPAVAQAARRQAIQNARKKGHTPDARTLLCCDYLLLFTTLPQEGTSPPLLLSLYRFRWQIECGFKRLKSLLHLDQMAAKEERLCRCFLLCKLLGALLVEELATSWGAFSPWEP